MKFLSLTLSLFFTSCLAADNRYYRTVFPEPGLKESLLQEEEVSDNATSEHEDELVTVSKKLQKYLDFDPLKYFADLKSNLVSIEEASKLYPPVLNYLESDSAASLSRAQKANDRGEVYVNGANYYLAKLLKVKTPLYVQQATFESWKDSGFSDVKFMELVKENMRLHFDGEYCRQLAENAGEWHLKTGNFLQLTGKESKDANYHIAQSISINFIYHGLITLNSADSAEFEKCIKSESFNGIRVLAKKIVSSNEYSEEFLLKILMMKTDNIDIFEVSKIALMANVFSEEFLLAWKENLRNNIQTELRARGVDFDMKSAVDSKDPKVIVKAYLLAINSTTDAATKNLCIQAMHSIRNIAVTLERLESLANRFTVTSKCDSSFMLKNVVEPAIIFINSLRVVMDFDYADSIVKVTLARKEKSNIIVQDVDLYKRILLYDKCDDYLQHENDFEFIRKDYDKMSSAQIDFPNYLPFHEVNKVVQELKKNSNEPKLYFDLTRGKLICNSPEMRDILIKILQNKYACKALVDFCENVIAAQSIPTAVDTFEEFSKKYLNINDAKYDVICALHPGNIKSY